MLVRKLSSSVFSYWSKDCRIAEEQFGLVGLFCLLGKVQRSLHFFLKVICQYGCPKGDDENCYSDVIHSLVQEYLICTVN